ncbi:MAG: ABC transporter permease subunit [Clostridia bacterium]|nr:ABC transporter permease subunit [Clostridia bacterium]
MLKAVYINELYKLRKKKKIAVSVVLTVIAVIIATAGAALLDNFGGVRIAGTASLPILVCSVLAYSLWPIYAILVTVDVFGGEFRDQTMKMTLLRPVLRWKVYLAKLAACITYVAASLVLTLVLTVVASLCLGVEVAFLKDLAAYALTLIPLAVFVTMVAFLSLLIKSTGGAFALSVGLFLLMQIFGVVNSHMDSFLFTSAFSWYRLFGGATMYGGKILRVFGMLVGNAALWGGLGLYLFEKRDL